MSTLPRWQQGSSGQSRLPWKVQRNGTFQCKKCQFPDAAVASGQSCPPWKLQRDGIFQFKKSKFPDAG
ncbi:hypothetical protein E2C01_074953 [Portunus trituberculatus]|uniref:Uncharacterized protein n=1 Tax=Portunus trituberculatus TaxID=210409 RepID=A0A5B7IIK6_PORTR|nr:hypothetical protein [Portunus trituberculatus]